ncbi:unnamed protein product [Effrenium voratum]|nr:unnamed protein product [Effrenium voratum]
MCRPDECVVMGECLPQSRADVEGAPAAASRGNFTALVLSGGGAKGAFELGVLEGICKNESLRHLRNWSMIVGTSIGALNAGALAQFPPHLQCTQQKRPAMTTKTGATELKEVPPGPPLPLALAGAVIQLSVMHYVWSTTSAGECLHAPLSCLLHPFQADAWGRTVIFVDLLALSTWAYSLHSVPHTGTSDPSIVDRLWSIMPWLYTWHWFLSSCWSGQANGRLLLMALLATMWGVRLTYNFYIKGGFSGGEDYRWAVVRRWYPGWQWEVFNLVFICCFQQVAVMAFTVPAVAALQSTAPLQVADLLSAALFVALFIGETVADKQMFEFQTEKYRRKAAGEPLKEYTDGFIQSGLWAYSRHPNYFCEVSMWWVFYLFSIPASGKVFNWTIWGAIFLSGLFVIPGASLDITEALSTSKYPEYAKYQQRVSKFFPLPSASASARAPQLATAKAGAPSGSARRRDASPAPRAKEELSPCLPKRSWRFAPRESWADMSRFLAIMHPAYGALTAAQRFWDSIKAPEDVWESSGLADVVAPQDPSTIREPCMSGTHLMSMAIAFWRKGGLCDPQPGRTAFEFAVKRERIRNSGMMLRVVATSLATGRGKWWDEKSEHIIQGCEASGAMAPVIYPMEVDHEGFVDGGFVANTPIMKALEEGAQTVLVVNLDPLSMGDLIPDLKNLTKSDDSVGMRILQFELSIMQQRYFLEHELQMACSNFKDRNIIAFTPKTEPGDFLSFSGEGLKRRAAESASACFDASLLRPDQRRSASQLDTLHLGESPKCGFGESLTKGTP